jgi:hypothetical protein
VEQSELEEGALRICVHCERPLPPGKRKYCDEKCRKLYCNDQDAREAQKFGLPQARRWRRGTLKTDLKFTAAEIRHIVCLLARNEEPPADLVVSEGKYWNDERSNEWRRDTATLWAKFKRIDRRGI